MTTHWLYPTSAASKFYLTVGGAPLAVDPRTFAAAVDESSASADSWIATTGYRLFAVDDLVWVYFGNPYSYLGGLGRVVRRAYERSDGYMGVDLLWDRAATKALLLNPIAASAFQDTPRSLRRFGDPAAAMLELWLAENDVPASLLSDPDTEPVSEADARRRREAVIVQRQGQADFRGVLRREYGDRCAISDCDVPGVLQAAHIRPYMGTHSNKPSNGLLLRADIHTLFDLNLIAFDPDGSLVLAPSLRGSQYASLAGRRLRSTTSPSGRPNTRALAEHRSALVVDE